MRALKGKRITIAGAGPSGLAASIILAREGRTVEVIERGPHPGHRYTGGFQVIDDYSLSEGVVDFFHRTHLPRPDLFYPLQQAVFFTPDGKSHTVNSAKPYGYLIRRRIEGSLDRALFHAAQESGVTFQFQTIARSADITATGPKQVDGVSMERHFSTDSKTRIWVLFHPELAPGGYAYLFTHNGSGTFGTAITRKFRKLPSCFDASLNFFRYLEPVPMEDIQVGHSYMNFFIKNSAVEAGTLYSGEAGGFQDFLFGLGLRQAMATGVLAAESLLTGEDYDTLWKTLLGSRPRVSLVNRFLYELGGAFGLNRFIALAAEKDFQTFLRSWVRGTGFHHCLYPIVALLWKNRGTCGHTLIPHWCRRR
ncbi:MAG TPA: NAD(P)/FAD-dependent oxidoreductase [Thermoanaerobaculia bacterium]|nr:NAD(P)/FAD-dependent oxidoreductase [Thermoanaerobaculia bacterium]HUM28762.1 NAD(P)/FAD-dependent oxidoreductase [Thermoanaerobaculia bacterium]HXK67988.1 NAD(P)/FAD-dependent oxidoreductase [Thermoanaerobaculia bacterium]